MNKLTSIWQLKRNQLSKSLVSKHWFFFYLHFVKTLRTPLLNLNSNFTVLWSLLNLKGFKALGWSTSRKYSKLKLELGTVNSFRRTSTLSGSPYLDIKLRKSSLLWNLFLQSWSIFRPKSNIIYQINRNFRLFFLTSSPTSTKLPLISVQRYFSRWVDSYNFLFNLFTTQPFTQMISNKLFIEESLVFNWNYSYKNYKLFKYVQPFFIFADVTHGAYVKKALSLLFLHKLDFTLTTDINNHNKLSGYLQKNNVFTVALIPNNYSPWRVSYPIPSFSDSSLTQLYFIRWVLSLQRQANASTYLVKARFWKSLRF